MDAVTTGWSVCPAFSETRRVELRDAMIYRYDITYACTCMCFWLAVVERVVVHIQANYISRKVDVKGRGWMGTW